jgi:tetratricopeptide (TPR) repeat protein
VVRGKTDEDKINKKMVYKVVFRGNFQFGNERSFGKVVETYNRMVESLYKGDVLLKPEQIFDEENFCLNLTGLVLQGTEKSIKNSAYLLEALSQFALSGQAWCWMVQEGKVLFSMHLYPSSDKTAVLAYLDGYRLTKELGKEQEALKKFDLAVAKFERHWTAFERRGYVYLLLQDLDKAVESYKKSIAIFDHQADAHSGLGRVAMIRGQYKEAVEHFDKAIKNSVPHQPIYWQSRRIKGECLVHLGQYDKAHFELNLCVKRQFLSSDPNHAWRKSAMLYMSRVLWQQNNQDAAAVVCFNTAMDIEDALEPVIEGEMAVFYENMLHKTGRISKDSQPKTTNNISKDKVLA